MSPAGAAPEVPHIHHYSVSYMAGPGATSRDGAGGGSSQEVRRHSFAEAHAESERMTAILRERGLDVREGVTPWQRLASPAAGAEPVARLSVDDLGVVDCDERCGVEIDPGPTPAAQEAGTVAGEGPGEAG